MFETFQQQSLKGNHPAGLTAPSASERLFFKTALVAAVGVFVTFSLGGGSVASCKFVGHLLTFKYESIPDFGLLKSIYSPDQPFSRPWSRFLCGKFRKDLQHAPMCVNGLRRP